jgi:hypothetical protein
MFLKVGSKIVDCIYGKLEKTCFSKRKTIGSQQTNTTGGTESSIGSVVSRSDEKKIPPDPWFT